MTQFNENLARGIINIPLFSQDKKYRSKILIHPHNKMNVSFQVQGLGKYNIRGRIITAKSIEKRFNGLLNIPLFNKTSNIKGSLVVKKSSLKKFNGRFIINPKNKMNMFLSVDSYGDKKVKCKFIHAIPKQTKFKSRLYINPKTYLDGRIDILGFNTKNIKGSIINNIEKTKKYNGFIYIPLFENDLNIEGRFVNKIYKEVKYNGRLIIPPKGTMFGVVDIIDTPERKYYGTLIKDSHVISTQPESNFGTDVELYYSKNSIVYFEWVMYPNEDIDFDKENELNTYLRLYLNKAVHKQTKGYVYLTSTDWKEHDINYNNKPNISKIVEFDIPINTIGQIDINLYDLLKDFDKSKTFNVSLAVIFDTDISISTNSKESSYNIPSLYYNYYYIPPTIRLPLFKGIIKVGLRDENLYKGKIFIKSGKGLSKFKGKFNLSGNETVLKYNSIIKILPIPKRRNSKFNSIITIQKFNKEIKFSSNMVVKLEGLFKSECKLTIKQFKVEKKVKGSISIRLDRDKLFLGNLNTPLFEENIKSKSIINIRLDNEKRILGNLITPLFEEKLNYKGNLSIRLDDEKLFLGNINIPLFEENVKSKGNISIRLDDEKRFQGNVDIPIFKEELNYKGTIVTKKEIDEKYKGVVNIPLFEGKKTVDGSITTRLDNEKIFSGNIDIPIFEGNVKNKGNLTIAIRYYNSFNGSLDIRLFEMIDEYKGKINIMIPFIIKYKSSIRIRGNKKRVRIFIM